MIPAISTVSPVAQGGQNTGNSTVQGKPDTGVPGQSRASAGVAAPSQVRTETARAVDPSRQSTTTPRLRDQETAERSARSAPAGYDGPTGPLPAFEETLLQRAARVIFEPPEPFREITAPPAANRDPVEPDADPRTDDDITNVVSDVAARQAEAAFETARKLVTPEDAPEVDVNL